MKIIPIPHHQHHHRHYHHHQSITNHPLFPPIRYHNTIDSNKHIRNPPKKKKEEKKNEWNTFQAFSLSLTSHAIPSVYDHITAQHSTAQHIAVRENKTLSLSPSFHSIPPHSAQPAVGFEQPN
ncbi:hypothetical protein ACMFMG_007818 [Clarireedia jacksonii]